MTSDASAHAPRDVVELPGRTHPVLLALAVIPLALLVVTPMALILEPVPLPLVVLLVAVMGCCAMVGWQALIQILGGKLAFTPEGLTVSRLFQQDFYAWQQIEKCKVMPATGTIGDNALADVEDRIGVGLFLRGLDRHRDHDLDADIVLAAGDRDEPQAMMRIAQRVQKAVERFELSSKRRRARPMPPPAAAGRQLRRTGQPARRRPTKKSADLVSAFRSTGD